MTAQPKLTGARANGLAVLAATKRARVSNATDHERGFVYWQTANWLRQNGYAYLVDRLEGAERIAITTDGLTRARAEGIDVAEVHR